jgi:hypothetical protein
MKGNIPVMNVQMAYRSPKRCQPCCCHSK